jgi:hypothetical protein
MSRVVRLLSEAGCPAVVENFAVCYGIADYVGRIG